MNTAIEKYVIRHLSGSKANQVEEFSFAKPELTIGRSAGSDIQFDPEQEVIVSREHGKIIKAESLKFVISDNNSRNGIFVNKVRVKGATEINPGDTVQLGNNGPVFSFDIYPRPQDMMMATRVVEIPAAIKPTTVSEINQADVIPVQPVKTGLGKQTVERMLVAERKKSRSSIAYALAGVLILLGVLGYSFRNKLFGKKETVIVDRVVADSSKMNKKTPDIIARENEDRVVQIEFGWQIFDAATDDELWHEYALIKAADGTARYAAMYIQNQQGQIEPYIDVKKEIQIGVPIGIAGASGSGFVVSEDGFILTNRHVAAGWNTSYQLPQFAFPGVLIQFSKGKREIVPNVDIMPQDVAEGWVPAEARMKGGYPVSPGSIKGRNTYMNVIFANTSLRRPVQSSTPSDNHDVAMIKVELPESLPKVTMKDNYNEVKPGQTVTVMGYPGIAPEQFIVRRSNDPFNNNSQFTSVPTPTVTTGNVGRIIPGSSAKNESYSTFGDSYQLTINATGAGNSGGPLFDDEGNVIGIYYAGRADERGTRISFAIPIKYGLELMGRKKITAQ